jgi:carbonic anhydrase
MKVLFSIKLRIQANPLHNVLYEPIIAAIPYVEATGKEKILEEPLLLEKLLLPDITMQDYFTYNGSLTTPPCYEIVTWIDFKEHLHLSYEQVSLIYFEY